MDKAKIHHRSWQQKNQINCRVFCPLRKHLKCKALTLNIQHECKHCRCRSWAVFMEGYVKTGKCRFFQVARRHFIIVFSSVFSWVHEATLDKYAQMSLIHTHLRKHKAKYKHWPSEQEESSQEPRCFYWRSWMKSVVSLAAARPRNLWSLDCRLRLINVRQWMVDRSSLSSPKVCTAKDTW